MKFYKGIAGKRSGKLKGVMIHNDAGLNSANKSFYKEWLKTHPAENGFAHAYTASDGTYYHESKGNRAWHCGNAKGNNDYYSIEVCQSKDKLSQFKKNETQAFKIAARVLRIAGLKPTRSTVRLHREVYSTSCPHRSYAIHGKSVNKVKDYFIKEIKKYMDMRAYLNKNQKVVIRYKPSLKGKVYTTKKKANQMLKLTQRTVEADGYKWLEYTTATGRKAYAPYYKLSNPNKKFWTLKYV